MADEAIKLGGKKRSVFIDKVKEILPEGGNLNLCLTCGACSSGCPATGLEGMDPRKFLRMAALGMDEEVLSTKWVWMCSMCTRCMYVCPMKINIPQLVFNARAQWPRDQRPKGILGSCDVALRNDTCSAMGATEEDFQFNAFLLSEPLNLGGINLIGYFFAEVIDTNHVAGFQEATVLPQKETTLPVMSL